MARLAESSGLRQYQIGRLLGPNPPRPTPKTLERLAPALGIDYQDLMKVCGYLPGEAAAKPRDPRLVSVNARWDGLSDELKDAVVRLTKRLRVHQSFA